MLAVTTGLVACAALATAQAERSGKVADVFAERCSACHGAQLQGGQAKSLLDDEWKYGGDDATLATSIRDGRLESGMPPFGAAMNQQDIRALVIFIREKADSARRAKTVFAKPQADTVVTSEEHAFRVETVTEGLETPWSVAFLPDGRMLVTEKAGRLRIVERASSCPSPWRACRRWSQGPGRPAGRGACTRITRPTAGFTCLHRARTPEGRGDDAGDAGAPERRSARRRADDLAPPAELYRTGANHFGCRLRV